MNRDLKPENIFIKLDEQKKPKAFLADGGSGRLFDILNDNERKKTKSLSSMFDWMAPEQLRKSLNAADCTIQVENDKLDVFSVGLLALFCVDPEGFRKNKGLFNRDEKLVVSYLDGLKPKISTQYYYILRCMLSFSPITRPSIDDLLVDFHHMISKIPEIEVAHSL